MGSRMSHQHRDQVDHDVALRMVTDSVLHGRSVGRSITGRRSLSTSTGSGPWAADLIGPAIVPERSHRVITGTCSKYLYLVWFTVPTRRRVPLTKLRIHLPDSSSKPD